MTYVRNKRCVGSSVAADRPNRGTAYNFVRARDLVSQINRIIWTERVSERNVEERESNMRVERAALCTHL